MKILLYFGSFNPVHRGHIDIALCAKNQYPDMDQVWFVLSPQSPFKNLSDLWPEEERRHLLNLALSPYHYFKLCDIELCLPQPSYTVKTLTVLSEKYPDFQFDILMGADNFRDFPKWKDYRKILEISNLYVYPREGNFSNDAEIAFFKVDSPLLAISSTEIREALLKKADCSAWLSMEVWNYLKKKYSI